MGKNQKNHQNVPEMMPHLIQNEQGRSMVEMLGVLAIVGVLSVGAISGYRYAMNKYRANQLVNDVNMRMNTLKVQSEADKPLDLSEWGKRSQAGYLFEDPTMKDGKVSLSILGLSKSICQIAKNGMPGYQVIVNNSDKENTACSDLENGNKLTVVLQNANSTTINSEGNETNDSEEEFQPSNCPIGMTGKNCELTYPQKCAQNNGLWNYAFCTCLGDPDCEKAFPEYVCGDHGDYDYVDKGCRCDNGYAGEKCDKLVEDVCGENRVWVNGFKACTCDADFAGLDCNKTNEEICGADGSWFIDRCNCYGDYVGPNCDITISEYCNGRASSLDSYTQNCQCEEGFAGERCEMSIGTVCDKDHTDSWNPRGACHCKVGYAGPQCDQSIEFYCNGHGIAWDERYNSCFCDGNTAGPRCEKTIQELCGSSGWRWTSQFGCICSSGNCSI